jgi:hypothetical protein
MNTFGAYEDDDVTDHGEENMEEKRRAQAWQHISTAPLDGSNVIISGRYPNGIQYVEESWYDLRGWWHNRKLDPPTHWQHLPLPPL